MVGARLHAAAHWWRDAGGASVLYKVVSRKYCQLARENARRVERWLSAVGTFISLEPDKNLPQCPCNGSTPAMRVGPPSSALNGMRFALAHPEIAPDSSSFLQHLFIPQHRCRQIPLLRSLGHWERFCELLSILFDPACCPALSFRDLRRAHLASQLLPFPLADLENLSRPFRQQEQPIGLRSVLRYSASFRMHLCQKKLRRG